MFSLLHVSLHISLERPYLYHIGSCLTFVLIVGLINSIKFIVQLIKSILSLLFCYTLEGQYFFIENLTQYNAQESINVDYYFCSMSVIEGKIYCVWSWAVKINVNWKFNIVVIVKSFWLDSVRQIISSREVAVRVKLNSYLWNTGPFCKG